MCKYDKVKTGSHQTCNAHNVVDAHCYAGSMEDNETLEQGMQQGIKQEQEQDVSATKAFVSC